MKRSIISSLTDNFESYAHQTSDGVEFWMARDLQHLLSYTKWDNFQGVISKAKTACELSEQDIDDHFADVGKTIQMPKADRKGQLLEDILLQSPQIKEIRRAGLFLVVELGSEEKVAQVVSKCLEKGIIGFWFLSTPTAFRLSPPLSITEEEIKEAGEVILECI